MIMVVAGVALATEMVALYILVRRMTAAPVPIPVSAALVVVSGTPAPVSDPPVPVSGTPAPVSDTPAPLSGAPAPLSGAPGQDGTFAAAVSAALSTGVVALLAAAGAVAVTAGGFLYLRERAARAAAERDGRMEADIRTGVSHADAARAALEQSVKAREGLDTQLARLTAELAESRALQQKATGAAKARASANVDALQTRIVDVQQVIKTKLVTEGELQGVLENLQTTNDKLQGEVDRLAGMVRTMGGFPDDTARMTIAEINAKIDETVKQMRETHETLSQSEVDALGDRIAAWTFARDNNAEYKEQKRLELVGFWDDNQERFKRSFDTVIDKVRGAPPIMFKRRSAFGAIRRADGNSEQKIPPNIALVDLRAWLAGARDYSVMEIEAVLHTMHIGFNPDPNKEKVALVEGFIAELKAKRAAKDKGEEDKKTEGKGGWSRVANEIFADIARVWPSRREGAASVHGDPVRPATGTGGAASARAPLSLMEGILAGATALRKGGGRPAMAAMGAEISQGAARLRNAGMTKGMGAAETQATAMGNSMLDGIAGGAAMLKKRREAREAKEKEAREGAT
jgi:predicted  nucleic acid-binding Zn-ribbon protein